jgi:hypothetical protein
MMSAPSLVCTLLRNQPDEVADWDHTLIAGSA